VQSSDEYVQACGEIAIKLWALLGTPSRRNVGATTRTLVAAVLVHGQTVCAWLPEPWASHAAVQAVRRLTIGDVFPAWARSGTQSERSAGALHGAAASSTPITPGPIAPRPPGPVATSVDVERPRKRTRCTATEGPAEGIGRPDRSRGSG
jgi:hypothetical protein